MEHSTSPESTTMGLEEGARFLRLGVKAMKELVDHGIVPATCLNQKHTVMLREDLVIYLREEGRRQANARRVEKLQGVTRPRRPRKPKPALPNLDRYEA